MDAELYKIWQKLNDSQIELLNAVDIISEKIYHGWTNSFQAQEIRKLNSRIDNLEKQVSERNIKQDGLTYDQIYTACKNIGVNLDCAGCSTLFFTGHFEPHDDSCSQRDPLNISIPAKSQTLYAIGFSDNLEEFEMVDGPTPDLDSLLAVDAIADFKENKDKTAYIIELNKAESTPIYFWDSQDSRWIEFNS